MESYKQLKRNPQKGIGEDINTQEKKLVMKGELIFKMMDSEGIPLDILLDQIHEHNISFDVKGFIQSAYLSKNYSKQKLRMMFEYNQPKGYEGFMQEIDKLLTEIYI